MKNKTSLYFLLVDMSGGGAERLVAALLKNINREKFNIKLVLLNKRGEYLKQVPSDVEIIDLKKKNRWDFFRLIFGLRKVIQAEHPDIVFSSLNYPNIINVLAGLFLKKKCNAVLWEHNYIGSYLPQTKLSFLRKLLMCFAYNRAKRIIAVSQGVKKRNCSRARGGSRQNSGNLQFG